jgi:hypothetical protein
MRERGLPKMWIAFNAEPPTLNHPQETKAKQIVRTERNKGGKDRLCQALLSLIHSNNHITMVDTTTLKTTENKTNASTHNMQTRNPIDNSTVCVLRELIYTN